MLRRLPYITLFLVSLVSCKDMDKGNKDKFSNQRAFIFSLNSAFTDAEKYVSFPVWFNDSLIAAQDIKKITRTFYYLTKDEVSDPETEMREKKVYWFNEEGQLTKMTFSYFYDDQKIGQMTFTYSGNKNKQGFLAVQVTEDMAEKSNYLEEEKDYPYFLHYPESFNPKYDAYREVESGDYFYFMKNKKDWGALTIDSVLNPTPYDLIFLGSPASPSKRYRVSNKVNEKDVVQWEYYAGTDKINYIKRYDYPFEFKRTFNWTEKGHCKGYIDSTFSLNNFLIRDLTEFVLDDQKRPLKVFHKKENEEHKTENISIELINYEK